MPFAAVHESGIVQVFGCRHDEAIHGLRRPASEKRQGTKSREVRQMITFFRRQVMSIAYYEAPSPAINASSGSGRCNALASQEREITPYVWGTAATTTRTGSGSWISGQVHRVTASIRREMKRRAAVEPVIGHVKAEHRMDRNYLRPRRRPHQRRPRRGRPQRRPAPAVARRTLACHHPGLRRNSPAQKIA
jgi:hypothetical protein